MPNCINCDRQLRGNRVALGVCFACAPKPRKSQAKPKAEHKRRLKPNAKHKPKPLTCSCCDTLLRGAARKASGLCALCYRETDEYKAQNRARVAADRQKATPEQRQEMDRRKNAGRGRRTYEQYLADIRGDSD